ncbi:uncharacterized protein LOC125316484 [Rhodamnia argentea]|uniref:Uncharacterized protein LOC125316484 n=1 Tax=Rhodamnia argentea TaxID=178133 RepID=A0ABM3HW16_9MYRT|nr:uncharacterized protein LOC125316484 [Rhodamnia argentea]
MTYASGSYHNSGYQNTQLRKPRPFTPLPMPLSQLLPALLGKQLVAKEVARANPPKYRGFDPSKSRVFHTREKRHDVDGCYILKHKVKDLLEGNYLSFKDFELNVHKNPLSGHASNVAIIEEVRSVTKKRFRIDVVEMYHALISNGHYKGTDLIPIQGKHVHIAEMFQNGVIWAIPKEVIGSSSPHVVGIPETAHVEPDLEVAVVEPGNPFVESEDIIVPEVAPGDEFDVLEPTDGAVVLNEAERLISIEEVALDDAIALEIVSDLNETLITMVEPVVIDLTVVEDLGNYKLEDEGYMVIDLTSEDFIRMGARLDASLDIVGSSFCLITVDTPSMVASKGPPVPINTKEVAWDYGAETFDSATRTGRSYASPGLSRKKPVIEVEAEHLLSVVKTSEFSVVDRLRKIPARISILELFQSSEKHKETLLKVLNEVHVPNSTGALQLEEFVGSIPLNNQISFSDENLPSGGPSIAMLSTSPLSAEAK